METELRVGEMRFEHYRFETFKVERLAEAVERWCFDCTYVWTADGSEDGSECTCAYAGNESECWGVMGMLEKMYEEEKNERDFILLGVQPMSILSSPQYETEKREPII
jgi:hypothetical protein